MTRLAILLALFVSPLGCNKLTNTTPGPEEKVKFLPGPGDMSGGGGAVQGTRMAAQRTVNDNDLNQFQLIISQAISGEADQRMPSADEIKDLIKQEGKLMKTINDEVIILTDTRKKDGIWAYTAWPQRGGKHYVLTIQGRGEMFPPDLKKALEAQGSPDKIAKDKPKV